MLYVPNNISKKRWFIQIKNRDDINTRNKKGKIFKFRSIFVTLMNSTKNYELMHHF